MGARLDRKGIREALGASSELGLVLATDADPEVVMPALVEAMDRADAAVGLPSSERDEVLNGAVLPTPAGIRFTVDPFDELAWEWLGHLGKNLTKAKVDGTITAETTARIPQWIRGSGDHRLDDPAPLLAIAYPKTDIDEDVAAIEALQGQLIDHLLEWLPADSFVHVNADQTRFVLPSRDPGPALHRVWASSRMALISGVPDPWQLREASWTQLGGDRVLCARVHAPSLTRTQQLEELTGLLKKWEPATAMYGFIMIERSVPMSGMIGLLRGAQPPALVTGQQYYGCADNYDAIVADAHGIQMLTGRHLARARDLSDWDVTEVAPDRYLVQAKDLDPWYATDTPAPQVVARAREDFGEMILTSDTVPLYLSTRWGGPGRLPA